MKQVEEPRPEQVLEAAPAMVGEPAIEVIGDGTAEGGGAGRGGPSGGPPPRPKGRQSFGTWLADLRTAAGSTGLFPLFVLLGLAAVERFDAQAFGVLGPEIRRSFHLSDSGFTAVFNLSTILPLFLAVFIGAASDRYNRSRITATAGWLWGATAVLTGLSPILGVLIAARLLGGVGLLVNEPVHPSLLADYYQPEHLPRVMSIHRQGSTIGLLGGPLAGVLVGAGIGWRPTFVLLAAPTFVLAAFALRLREPSRGGTLAMAPPADEHVPIGEAFRRLRSIRTLKRTWVAAFFFGSGVLPLINILNLYFDDVFHAGPAVRGGISFLYGLFGVFGLIIGARYTERLSTERGPRWLPIVNGAMIIELAVGLVLLAASPWIAAAAICNAIIGLGAFGFFPAYLTMVARVTPPRLRSQAFSWSLIWFALGGLILSQIAVGFDNRRVTLLVLAAFVAAGGIAEITAEKFVERDIDQAANAEATSTSTALLACHKLDAGYDQVQILFGVDLEIFEGEIVALLGTNGAGKSTLLKAISGLIDPIGGAVYFDGRDITHADANTTARLGIAQVPGGRGVFPTLTVGENLRIAGWMYRSDAA
ncbi:MAG: hypothetical protein QOG64_3174, partial [Acidimicrobiaceae bacterium]|nr:hypothetical protein [Acidimicrobiaceae bacterium]